MIGWTKVEEKIITKIKEIENVDRAEAIRRMQRRKDSLHLRGASDLQLETKFKKFIRPEFRRIETEMSPQRLEAIRKAQKARHAKIRLFKPI